MATKPIAPPCAQSNVIQFPLAKQRAALTAIVDQPQPEDRHAIEKISDRLMHDAKASNRQIAIGPMFTAMALAGIIDKLADVAGRTGDALALRNAAMNLVAQLADGGVYA